MQARIGALIRPGGYQVLVLIDQNSKFKPAHEPAHEDECTHIDVFTATNLPQTAKWWAHQDLNLGPVDYESIALTN